MTDLARRAAAEAIGTAFLVAAVVGSGIMAQRLTGDAALALLCNGVATGAMLVVLISVFGPVSGAHINPAVTLVLMLKRRIAPWDATVYALMQVVGGLAGTVAAHLMFSEPALQLSMTVRSGASLWFSEAVATFGLVLVILLGARLDRPALPWLVGLYIASAYWFTASTSFANPAVTFARIFTDSFAGIHPADGPAFVVAQLAGALAALALANLLAEKETPRTPRERTGL